MKPSVYVENSVISYLTARRASKNVRVAGHQEVTREWWNTRRHEFDLYASAVVIEEAREGDAGAAAARLETIAQLTLLEVSEAARELPAVLLRDTRLPSRAAADALHIATAAVHGHGLPHHVELHAHCKCCYLQIGRAGLSRARIRAARDVHA